MLNQLFSWDTPSDAASLRCCRLALLSVRYIKLYLLDNLRACISQSSLCYVCILLKDLRNFEILSWFNSFEVFRRNEITYQVGLEDR